MPNHLFYGDNLTVLGDSAASPPLHCRRGHALWRIA
jgi:hypothetical protein